MVTKTQIAFDVTLPVGMDIDLYAGREAWESIVGITHYDAGTVACLESDADSVEKSLRDAGYAPANRRTAVAAHGTSEDVIRNA